MPSFSILCANLGNAEVKYFNPNQLNKLVSRSVEQRITRRIHRLNPDVVVYQESIGYLEYQGRDPELPQIRRILGSDYSIVADKRFQLEGIAIKTSVGCILGCRPGNYKKWSQSETHGNACDEGFGNLWATIRLKDGFEFELAAFHLHSTLARCRVQTLMNMLIGNPAKLQKPLLHHPNLLIAGDFNLDPWRQDDPSERIFRFIIGRGWRDRPLKCHNRLAADGKPYFTSIFPFLSRTIDMVWSNFAEGELDALGATPITKRLDGGRGCDHLALFGTLNH
jgi:endonuclease/exonuclease/phosphatase family metal-dependent hydrolase